MAIKIRGTTPSSIDALPNARLKVNHHSKRVDETHKTYSDVGRGQTAPESVEWAGNPKRYEFQLALQTQGLDGQLAEQLLPLYDLLQSSDTPSSQRMADLLYRAVDAGDVNINRQFYETVSMLIDAVTDGGLVDS